MMKYPEWKNNGKIKLAIIVGTRPEIIRLAAIMTVSARTAADAAASLLTAILPGVSLFEYMAVPEPETSFSSIPDIASRKSLAFIFLSLII